jgi:hypothetical protein
VHAYVDESIRGRDYILCATLLEESSVARVRQSLKTQLRGHQSRLHMAKESSETKSRLLAHVARLDTIRVIITVRATGRSARAARDECLNRLTTALAAEGLRRLVIESCDQDVRDRQVVGDSLATAGLLPAVELVHHRASDEPLLWLPDIVAWAYGKSGSWRERLSPLPLTEMRF